MRPLEARGVAPLLLLLPAPLSLRPLRPARCALPPSPLALLPLLAPLALLPLALALWRWCWGVGAGVGPLRME